MVHSLYCVCACLATSYTAPESVLFVVLPVNIKIKHLEVPDKLGGVDELQTMASLIVY